MPEPTPTPAPAPTPSPAPAPAPTPAPSVWYAGKVDAETQGWLQNRGLHDKTPEEVALATIKGHREAESKLGAPANELVRVPKDPNDPTWKQVWQRLGAPPDATGYDFSAVVRKDAAGAVLPADAALTAAIAATAAEVGLTKDAAARVAAAVLKHNDAVAKAAGDTSAADLAVERQKLAQDWGANADVNKIIAQRAATALGITPDAVAALEKVAGYGAAMNALLKVGQAIGEARFLGAGPGGGPQILTKEQAVAALAELKNDTAWVQRYTAGGIEEKRKFDALNQIIAGAA